MLQEFARRHLTFAIDGALPVRMVVEFPSQMRRGASRGYHVRPDLIGKVVQFDGDHFMVDFTRPEQVVQAVNSKRRR